MYKGISCSELYVCVKKYQHRTPTSMYEGSWRELYKQGVEGIGTNQANILGLIQGLQFGALRRITLEVLLHKVLV
jgi:hypothetical protein